MRRLTVHPSQTQIPAAIHGATNRAAGERAKQRGMAQAAKNTDADWATACDKAIRTLAARGVVFQAADLIEQQLVSEPDHPNRWGSRFGKAARDGVIRFAGYDKSKRATVRKSICKTWIGTEATR